MGDLKERVSNLENKLLYLGESIIKNNEALKIVLKNQEDFLDWFSKIKKAFSDSGYQF